MQFLTYDEYKNIGGTLDDTAFYRNIDRACNIIDSATYGRLKNVASRENVVVEFDVKYGRNSIEIPIEQMFDSLSDNVKALCRDLVEYLHKNNGLSKEVSSESVSAGATSKSKTYITKTSVDKSDEIEEMIRDYLSGETDSNGTPLLYRGCKV
jgi:hypothetical protein